MKTIEEPVIQILWKFAIALILNLINLSAHKSAHVMTAELSWHVQNCVLIGSLFFIKGQHICKQILDY